MSVQFTAWSPTRLADYEQCPFLAKHKHLLKTCPKCFKGRITGGFDTPAVCDACGVTIVKAAPLERGSEIGASLERFVNGKGMKLHEEISHPKVVALAKELRVLHRQRKVQVEINLTFNRSWQVVKGWSKDAWLRTKLDVLRFLVDKLHVIDWKTGNIDKMTGNIKAAPEKYDDQLEIYNVAGLTAFVGCQSATSALVFVDCGARFNPIISRAELHRKDLPTEQAKWERRVLPMFRDDTFAPRANNGCKWCDFQKAKGGPCKY